MVSIFLISKVKMRSYNGWNQDQGGFYLKLGRTNEQTNFLLTGVGGQCLSLD